MVKKTEAHDLRRRIIQAQEKFNDLDQLLTNADQLAVDPETSPAVEEYHQAFIDDLLEHYFLVEEVLSRADKIEDPGGRVIRDLPGNVPDFVTDRVNNRPDVPAANTAETQEDDQQ